MQHKQRLDRYKKVLIQNDVTIPIFHSSFQATVKEVLLNQNFIQEPFPLHSNLNLKYFLITGVGNPKNVYETAKSTLLSESIRTKFFPDHFEYATSSLLSLLNEIQTSEILITTEKDWIKMRKDTSFTGELVRRNIRVFLLLIQVSIEEDEEMKSMLAGLVSTYESKTGQVSGT